MAPYVTEACHISLLAREIISHLPTAFTKQGYVTVDMISEETNHHFHLLLEESNR
jgi:hypothetical protein